MPITINPFPGINPFFQAAWSDVHTRLISYIGDALSESLPPDLSARAEERIVLAEVGEKKQNYRADVAIIEPWQTVPSPVVSFDHGQGEGSALVVAEPLVFAAGEMTERWVEIHDADGDLITVIEVLSPANKRGLGQRAYQDRQDRLLSVGVQLVEIDLIRGGAHVVNVPLETVRPHYPAGTCHLVCTTRWPKGEGRYWEVYLCPLRQPLPAIRVPLRPDEPDVPLALQPLVDRCYRTGRYWLGANSAETLQPPLADSQETAWVEERLRTAAAGTV